MPPADETPTDMTKNLSEEMQRNARQALAGLQPVEQGEEVGGLPVSKLLSAFFRARYLVIGTTLFGVLIGTFMAITTPNSYISTGKFLFTSSGAESRVLDPTQAKETSQETIATGAAYILNSDDLLMRVVKRLTPQRILQPYQPSGTGENAAKDLFFKIQRDWNAVDESMMTEEEALKRLQKTIFVERPRFTEMLIATCAANNNELARDILATFMDEAVTWHIEKYESRKAYDAAKDNFDEDVKAHEVARRAMREFLDRKAQVPQFDQHMRAVVLAETEALTRLEAVRDDLVIKQLSKASYDEQLADPEKLPPTKTRKVRQSLQSEIGAELRTRLLDAMVELSRLKRQFVNPEAPEIKAQESQIEDISGAIKALSGTGGESTLEDEVYDNPDYVKALEERGQIERELLVLEAQVKQAGQVHAEKEKELKRLLELEPQYEELRAALLRAESAEAASAATWEYAQKKHALGLGQFSTLNEVQAASLPLEKEGPNRGKLLMGGLFVGLFLGLGLVVLRALPDRVVRTRDDLEEIEGLSVIGVMPRLDRTNLRRHMARREQGW